MLDINMRAAGTSFATSIRYASTRVLRMLAQAPFTNGTFIAICAAAITWETSVVASIPRQPVAFYAFVFFATFVSYRLHAIARAAERTSTQTRHSLTPTILAAIAALACGSALPIRFWLVLLLAAAVTAAYSLPILPRRRRWREFGLIKIVSLAGVWTLITAYLPAAGLADNATLAFLVVRRFAFLFALCLAFDIRDHAHDARAGIRTLPVRIGVDRAYRLAYGTLLLFAVMVLLAPLIQQEHRPAASITAALLASAIATWLAIHRSRSHRDAHLYYLRFVDGMMLVQAILVAAAFWASTLR